MKLTKDFLVSFSISLAAGVLFFTLRVTSRMVVATMKKNKSMNTISGRDAVEIPTLLLALFFLNFAILFFSYTFRFSLGNFLRIFFFHLILLAFSQVLKFTPETVQGIRLSHFAVSCFQLILNGDVCFITRASVVFQGNHRFIRTVRHVRIFSFILDELFGDITQFIYLG